MTALSIASYALAAWLSFLQQYPSGELPVLIAARSEIVAAPETPAEMVVDEAMSLLGSPYKLGGTDPDRGIDCSSLVRQAYSTLGIELPQSAAQQIRVGETVDKDAIEPGDLVFFKNTYKKGISHVGIALGDDLFVHASGRRRGVIVSSLDEVYYRQRYAGARRPAHSQAGGS